MAWTDEARAAAAATRKAKAKAPGAKVAAALKGTRPSAEGPLPFLTKGKGGKVVKTLTVNNSAAKKAAFDSKWDKIMAAAAAKGPRK